ncbi:MAG: hypothetical protein QM495_09270 [Lutibacter sp.]|uniref:hypothetical protein n=1 Tax=Lutibacter sp. TaxID=1925666 RepID=UPI003859E29A
MKKIMLFISLLFIANTYAQQIGKVEIKKESGFAMKKFADAPKKIFIQDFFVNYQMLYDQVEIAKGGREIGGGHRGKAKAQLVLGVQGVSETDLQEITDKLYAEYISKLKAKGFQIITADEASKIDRFKDWKLVKGGAPSKAQFPGYVSTAPTDVLFLVRKMNSKGKIKKKSIFDNGMGTSKDLGGTVVARVNIVIPFIKDAESQGSKALTKTFGGVAKIVAKTELSITKSTSVTKKGAWGKVLILNSSSLFAYKEGLKNQASLIIVPKKKILINGVFESKKYKAIKSASQDLWGTSVGALRVFNVNDQVLKKMQAVSCDSEKYKNGVFQAGLAYLNKSLDPFLVNIK